MNIREWVDEFADGLDTPIQTMDGFDDCIVGQAHIGNVGYAVAPRGGPAHGREGLAPRAGPQARFARAEKTCLSGVEQKRGVLEQQVTVAARDKYFGRVDLDDKRP